MDIDREIMIDFIDESVESMSAAHSMLVQLETNPDDLELVQAIFRPIHSLKGNAAYFGMGKTKSLAHDLESLLDDLRKGKARATPEMTDLMLEGVDELSEILQNTRSLGAESIDEERYDRVRGQIMVMMSTAPKSAGPSTENATQPPLEEPLTFASGFEQLKLLAAHPLKDETLGQAGGLIELLVETAVEADQKKVLVDARDEFRTLVDHLGNDPMVQDLLVSLVETLKAVASTEAAPVSDPSDEHPIEGLASLGSWTSDPDGVFGARVQSYFDALSQCLPEEGLTILGQSRDEFELFFGKVGFDLMLCELVGEAAEKLRPYVAPTAQTPSISETESAAPDPEPVEDHEPQSIELVEHVDLEPETPKASESLQTRGPDEPRVEASAETKPDQKSREPARTMRVSEEAVDVFLGYVGELIAVDEMFRFVHSEMAASGVDLKISSAFMRVVNTFTKLSDDLQRSIMEIRKVPVGTLLQKSQRIIRDIARGQEKLVETKTGGSETRIDRSLLETLEAPVLHMVRNAVDHGLETPAERTRAGKVETGVVEIVIEENEEHIQLTIRDDGRGLNFSKIREKAERQGLLQPDQDIDDGALANMIFAPGFSTAEQVTDVSGRGVGMDAAKKDVEAAGGMLSIESETGRGSTFLIQLPKTVGTQILNSFVVTVGEERYVLPMERIAGSFRPKSGDFHRVPDGSLCVRRHDKILPIVELDGVCRRDPKDMSQGILIAMESRIKPFAFYADAILGMQKVVLRNVPWYHVDQFIGAAIMGDGKVSMILNISRLEDEAVQV